MLEDNLRPKSLDDYIGQSANKENLKVYIESAKKREKVLAHVLIHGAAGLGKTSLASVIANEYGANIIFANAANIEKSGDLVQYFMLMEEGDFLFIDEIHRLDGRIEENLYTAMEDFRVDIKKQSGSTIKPISLSLEPFTLIGATTMKGKLSTPLIDRFGINVNLNPYTQDELIQIIDKNSEKLGFKIDNDGMVEIAKRSRGTPRKANHIIHRLFDFVTVKNIKIVDTDFVCFVLDKLKIDEFGLEEIDRKVLKVMRDNYSSRPVGINAIASSSGESKDTIESDIEPYLLQMGFVERTPRGRVITEKGIFVIKSLL